MNDSDLLIQFTRGSEKAFAELVRRHVDLVFAAALRHVAGDRHRAEDIVQQVFIDLARKARTLTKHPTLAGWLYSSTRYTAINTLRSEQRRSLREKQSDVMNPTTGTEPRWEQIRPVIDEAMQELEEEDRQSVLLRFFGQQPFAAIAAQLGITENAAQKRVDRALDRLNIALKRRGISSTVVALGLALGESCVAAPATLAGTVTAAALAPLSFLGVGTVALATGLKIAAAAAVAGALGWAGTKWLRTPVVEQKQTLPPMVADAKPFRTKTESDPATAEGAPKAIGPIENKSVERIATKAIPISTPTPAPKMYEVRPRDTLKRIASAVRVTPEALRAQNPGYDFTRMSVGEYVQLPAGATDPQAEPPMTGPTAPIPPDQAYVIQPEDTLLKIAQKRDLLPEELKALNPETNWQQLRVGQQIRAP